ncbi:MAG: glycolate oxidase binding subunit [Thermoleophilaceae bacterium]|nr:glycolate oxidase binding subunit [Thermoleophilaceae bacterium]
MHVAEAPATREDLCSTLAAAAEAGTPVRFRGGGTKAGWPPTAPPGAMELSTAGLTQIVEHNAGDLTAVLEAGVPLAEAQALFAKVGQRLALDPPDNGATVGGVVASGDTGPLRGRYGGPRDLVVGMRVALSDGTLAKTGGKVIKNVAGYDIAKLFAGSFGTLGAIVEVSVRLHPIAPDSATALGTARDPDELGRGAAALGQAAIEHQGLDIRWQDGRGTVLARFAGAAPGPQAEAAERLLRAEGLSTEIAEDDEPLWDEQRAAQRGPLVVKVSSLPTRLPELVRAVDEHGGSLVGRATLGLSWARFEEPSVAAVERLRRDFVAAVLDRPAELDVDPVGPIDPPTRALMQRVKERFDPAGVCV